MKQWVRRITLAVVSAVAALVFLVVTGSVAGRQLSIRNAERAFPPPGRILEFDHKQSHIACMGSGSPVIVLESGLDTSGSTSWAEIQSDLASISRVCAYDRAGIMWSEPRNGPRDAEQIARELHALLDTAGETPPYVLVGHSYGGLLALVYDQLYPSDVAGFVFVDSSHPDQDDRWPEEIRARMTSEPEPIPRWLFRLAANYRTFVDGDRSPENAYWWRSFPDGLLGEAAAVEASSLQAARTTSVGSRPVVVLTAGEMWPMPDASAATVEATRQAWLAMHADLANLSTNSRHQIVSGADHYIHKGAPEAVIAAIHDVVVSHREGVALRAPPASVGQESP